MNLSLLDRTLSFSLAFSESSKICPNSRILIATMIDRLCDGVCRFATENQDRLQARADAGCAR